MGVKKPSTNVSNVQTIQRYAHTSRESTAINPNRHYGTNGQKFKILNQIMRNLNILWLNVSINHKSLMNCCRSVLTIASSTEIEIFVFN